MSILSTHNLTVGYRKGNTDTPILSSLNLSVEQGKLVALLGANGIGKSTLLRTITGDQAPLEGNTLLNGTPINYISKKELSRLLSIVNTDRTQAGGLTVRELVSLGRQPYTGFLGILDSNDRSIVEDAMHQGGISHKANSFLAELSDGERQKVMIAKALAQSTPIIILDEPTAFLDVESRMETMLLLHRLAHEHNKAILLSSHDLSQAVMLADELWIITHDRQVLSGNTEDLALTGAMDSIFASQNISFNLSQGDFCINIDCPHSVNLKSDDAVLTRWIANALARNGYRINSDSQCDITITATSPRNFSVEKANRLITATSINDLIAALATLS